MGTELRGARSRRLCTKEPWEGDWSGRRGRKEGSSLRLKEFIGHSADTLSTVHPCAWHGAVEDLLCGLQVPELKVSGEWYKGPEGRVH